MNTSKTLKIVPSGSRGLVISREFNAHASQVFDAWTQPGLLKEWLLGPPGWNLSVCNVDLCVGGSYRFVWRNDDGQEYGMGGTYREITRPGHLVHTERFDKPWYPGEATLTTKITEKNGKTFYTCAIHYESAEAQKIALASNMTDGLGPSCDRLDGLLATLDVPTSSIGGG